MSLVSGAHIKYELAYHVQWCTKYRCKFFAHGEYREDYKNVLTTVASWCGIQLVVYAVMPEHVHVIVSIPSTMTLQQLFQYLKGATPFQFFRLHPEFRMRYSHVYLFNPGKFCRAVGLVEPDTEINYVRNQSARHAAGIKQRKIGAFLDWETEGLALGGCHRNK